MHMIRYTLRLLVPLAVFLLSAGCAGLSSTVSPEIVDAWSQSPDERGTLAVGVVATVERVHFQRASEPPTPAIASPQAAAASIAVVPLLEAIRNADWMYRTTVKMKDGSTRVVDLNYKLEPRVCVAFRPGLSADSTLPVKALPGECDSMRTVSGT